jgi:hypothetical protein
MVSPELVSPELVTETPRSRHRVKDRTAAAECFQIIAAVKRARSRIRGASIIVA